MTVDVLQFVKDNEAVIALFGLAFVVRMPEGPPPPLDRVPFIVWHWHWLREGLLTFVSFRSPSSPAPSVPLSSTSPAPPIKPETKQ